MTEAGAGRDRREIVQGVTWATLLSSEILACQKKSG